jgi:hypothetical protein
VAPKPLWDELPDPGWVLLAHLVPKNRAVVPQHAIRYPDGQWALTQGQDSGSGSNTTDNLILTQFGRDQEENETRSVPRGGHGDRAYLIAGYLVTQVRGVWSRITFGSPWSWGGVARPPRCPLPAGPGCQGETQLPDGTWLRLYGESIKGGSERDWSHRTAFAQVIDGLRVTRTVDLDSVARDPQGNPLGGRYEPEGIQVTDIDGEPWVLVGFSVGRLGDTTMNVYGRPLRLF